MARRLSACFVLFLSCFAGTPHGQTCQDGDNDGVCDSVRHDLNARIRDESAMLTLHAGVRKQATLTGTALPPEATAATPATPLQYWVDDGCHTENGGVNSDDVVGDFKNANDQEAFARCCTIDGTRCSTPSKCLGATPGAKLTFAQASGECSSQGLRLCTKEELLSEMCCSTGGNCDNNAVWTSTQAGGCVVTYDAAISGHNVERLTGQTVAECETACHNAAWGCKSFDYYKNSAKCDLSGKSADDVGGLKTNYAGNPYDHYSCNFHAYILGATNSISCPSGYAKIEYDDSCRFCSSEQFRNCKLAASELGLAPGAVAGGTLPTGCVYESRNGKVMMHQNDGPGMPSDTAQLVCRRSATMKKYDNGTHNSLSKTQAMNVCKQHGKHLCTEDEVKDTWSAFSDSCYFYGWLSGNKRCIMHGSKARHENNCESPVFACGYPETNTYNALCC